MATVIVEDLSFVNVSTATRGNFSEGDTLTRFLGSEVGKAQERLMRDQMAAQLNVGITDKTRMTQPADIDLTSVRRALILEQSYQDTKYTKPELSTAQLMDRAGPAWYERIGNLVSNWGRAGDQAVRDGANAGANATATLVTNNSGYSGQAAAALSGREAQIERAVNESLGITPGGRKP